MISHGIWSFRKVVTLSRCELGCVYPFTKVTYTLPSTLNRFETVFTAFWNCLPGYNSLLTWIKMFTSFWIDYWWILFNDMSVYAFISRKFSARTLIFLFFPESDETQTPSQRGRWWGWRGRKWSELAKLWRWRFKTLCFILRQQREPTKVLSVCIQHKQTLRERMEIDKAARS